MRKLFVLPMVLAVFFADFGAFGATARGGRGNSNATNATSAPVTARAAVRGAKTASTTAAQPTKQNAPVAARAATRNTPKTTASAGGAVAARAGAKQKVINMGTKIAGATTNTTVDQECQNAFFGCMDSFCMLDNISGGRCQCSDKNAEHETLLAAIMEMDEQSQVLQTEGVSLLKMGKSADEVYAMAEQAAKKVGVDGKNKDKKQDSKKSLDLSAWNNDLFADVDIEIGEEDVDIGADIKNKKGDSLQTAVAKICVGQVPDKCKGAINMLRPMYTQKITSDCAAFGNSLKQQQMESNQKLLAAKQALRDTALEKYNEANRYDLGECVREYTSCMQQEDVCGDGFLGCVTFAAVDNMQSNSSGKVAKQTTIKGTYSSFTLAASTMEQLMSKRVMCDSVLEQCVNVQSRVWDSFLKNAAPLIKVAESNAESDLRMNCIDTVSKCFQKACKEQMDPNDPDGSYDGCLNNPDMYKSLCKVQLEPCLLATGGTYDKPEGSSLWESLKARLNSMKVDACTQEVRDCLLSEDRCGKDYAGCIGLSTYEIGNLCPSEKLTACVDKTSSSNDPETALRDYVARVAQGLALNIDNSMLTQCQTALSQAMIKYCGDEESCPMAKIDDSLFKGVMSAELCVGGNCQLDPGVFSYDDLLKAVPTLKGLVDITQVEFKSADKNGGASIPAPRGINKGISADYVAQTYGKYVNNDKTNNETLNMLEKALNSAFANVASAILSDPKVYYCMYGRSVDGFGGTTEGTNGTTETGTGGRFPSLATSMLASVETQIKNTVTKVYYDTQDQLMSDQIALINKMNARISELNQAQTEVSNEQQHSINAAACNSFAQKQDHPSVHGCNHDTYVSRETSYNRETFTCTIEITTTKRKGCNCGAACPWKDVVTTKTFVLPGGNAPTEIDDVKAMISVK